MVLGIVSTGPVTDTVLTQGGDTGPRVCRVWAELGGALPSLCVSRDIIILYNASLSHNTRYALQQPTVSEIKWLKIKEIDIKDLYILFGRQQII